MTENTIIMANLDPMAILSIGSPDNYEQMIEEWSSSYLKEKCGKYIRIENLGGAGDKGRDIVATINEDGDWDNYQCKHYGKKLSPSMIWVEIAKICYYVFRGDYVCPKKYYFVSPKGVGSDLRDLLQKPIELRGGLICNWDKYCKLKITTTEEVELTGEFKTFIESFDFSIFDHITPLEFIEQFKQTPYYTKRFGRLSKPRPLTDCPQEIKDCELEYIGKILCAYSEHLDGHLESYEELEKHPDLKKHFNRQRYCYYEAQTLKEFSREIHDPALGHFEKYMEEIYSGIIDEIEDDAKNGFVRLKNVLKRAAQIQISNNPLSSDVKVNDRHGMCHHLANEREDVKWVR